MGEGIRRGIWCEEVGPDRFLKKLKQKRGDGRGDSEQGGLLGVVLASPGCPDRTWTCHPETEVVPERCSASPRKNVVCEDLPRNLPKETEAEGR